MKAFQYRSLRAGDRIVVTHGANKGLTAVLDEKHSYSWSQSTIPLPVQPRVRVKYVHAELADEQGNPIIVPVTDMTGREITEGQWLTYSVGGNKSPHGLELGRVEGLTAAGGVRVTRVLRDGEKVINRAYYRDRRETKVVNDPDRSLLLPCDGTTMVEWVLKDFENLKENPFA